MLKLAQIEGLENKASGIPGSTSLFYLGQEFAHFHSEQELDLKLGKTLIRELGLTHPAGSIQHPDRSPNSAWIELRFASDADVQSVAELVGLATTRIHRVK
ncbi:luciferase domain-containing protein [Roseateles oligotrophus]|uniref:luciferase domain-containing protein n=1 Tax=Roseateles oligotrophus TaxID=1769250 RepID=UPI0021E3E620|nr:luciferase family protein [Roseateles oligotrophus]